MTLALRPLVHLRYDRIASDACLLDAACRGSHNVVSPGMRASWMIR